MSSLACDEVAVRRPVPIRCSTMNGRQAGTVRDAPVPSEEEAAIHAAIGAGQTREALTALMGLYGGQVYNYCLAMLGSKDDAADTLQTVFKEAFVDLPRFEPRGRFKAWLLGMARS